MQLGYVIIYVDDVLEAVEFYERAFALRRAFVHEEGQFAQLDTGTTALAFTSHALAATAVPVDYRPVVPSERPPGFELTLITRDVPRAFELAVSAGATPLAGPHDTPWGQTVAYVKDRYGVIVGLGTPVPP